VINTGVFFNLAWKVLSIMISEKTKRNIKILGKNYIEQLQADVNIILERDLLKINIFCFVNPFKIPIENIPKFLGGKCTCLSENCINNNPGP